MQIKPRNSAIVFSGIYFLVSILYIYLSDTIISTLSSDKDVLTQIQTFKGFGFVSITTGIIFFLIYNLVSKLNQKIEKEHILNQQLNEQKNSFSLLFLHNPAPMWIYEINTLRFIEVNDAAIKKYGFTREEFLKMTLKDIRPSDEVPKLVENLIEHTEDYQISFNWKHRTKSGDVIFVDVYSHSVIFNEIAARHVMIVDITEKKKYLEDLVQAKEYAELSNKLIAAFLQNISHEVRTPIHWMVGYLNLLEDKTISESDASKYSKYVQQGSNRLITTMDNLIVLSEMESGVIKPKPENINLVKLVNDILEIYQRTVYYSGQKLEVKIPESNAIADVTCDKKMITLVLDCLLSNAVKFSDEGVITFGYNYLGDQVEFFVEDTGIGINEEHHKQIFEKFFQVDSSISRPYEGTGIGLSIALKAAEFLGGRIDVKSKVGEGSKFTFSLPL
ncbi:hypothetical protein MASR1M45_25130 [Candidatus Kapaibacterium sp.]